MTAPVVLRGDARQLPLPGASVDAIVTDPPYDLTGGRRAGAGFMGQAWDATGVAFDPATWAEALRVLKPGGHLLAFGGTRTAHRMTCAVEDAGLEIRDSIGVLGWVYAGGFPKDRDVARSVDSELCTLPGRHRWTEDACTAPGDHVCPTTDAGASWAGWGTALRPAWEPIVVARKPLAGTVGRNVLAYGTGGLNVDGCRIDADRDPRTYTVRRWKPGAQLDREPGGWKRDGDDAATITSTTPAGRWPANVVLVHHPDCAELGVREVRGNGHHPATRAASAFGRNGHGVRVERHAGVELVPVTDCVPGCPVAELDDQGGIRTSGANPTRRQSDKFRTAYGEFAGQRECVPARGADTGAASRFFPVFRFNPKAAPWERPTLTAADGSTLTHPTVKPVDLCRWLVRMITPPGGLVADLFTGTGAILQAAQVEGFRSVGVELDAGHCRLAAERLSWRVRLDRDDRLERLRPVEQPDGQGGLW